MPSARSVDQRRCKAHVAQVCGQFHRRLNTFPFPQTLSPILAAFGKRRPIPGVSCCPTIAQQTVPLNVRFHRTGTLQIRVFHPRRDPICIPRTRPLAGPVDRVSGRRPHSRLRQGGKDRHSVKARPLADQTGRPASVGQRTDTRSAGPAAFQSQVATKTVAFHACHMRSASQKHYKIGNANPVTRPCRLEFPAWPIWANTVRDAPCPPVRDHGSPRRARDDQ